MHLQQEKNLGSIDVPYGRLQGDERYVPLAWFGDISCDLC